MREDLLAKDKESKKKKEESHSSLNPSSPLSVPSCSSSSTSPLKDKVDHSICSEMSTLPDSIEMLLPLHTYDSLLSFR